MSKTALFNLSEILPLTVDAEDSPVIINAGNDGDTLRLVVQDDTQTTDYAKAKAFAEFVAMACNSHDALVKALTLIEESFTDPDGMGIPEINAVRSALALARGGI